LKNRVLVTRKLFPEAIKIIEMIADVEVFEADKKPIPRELLLNNVEKVDGLLCLLTEEIDKEVMDAGGKLKVISNYAVGYDNIDIDEATKRGIRVTNTPGVLTNTTADFTFAILMVIGRRIIEADRYIREGKWDHPWSPKLFLGMDIYKKKLGIVGLGRIGAALAERAKGFDMDITYFDKVRNRDLENKLDINYSSISKLLQSSDYVSIHVPLTNETYHLIGRKDLEMMKETSFLINTSRGSVVEERTLYEFLKDRKIAGAALDVFEDEPIDRDNPLLKLDNVVLTPHIASSSIDTRKKMAIKAAKNLIAVLKGEEPPNLVNEEVLEK
jgi:glyoxylate reductase